jgi:outer membrane protein
MKRLVVFFGILACVRGETVTLTLKQVVDLALRQNPDLMAARLDEQRAALEVRAVSEPLVPRVYAGSGLAYTNGFPMSIEGSAPAIVQAKAIRSVFNRPQSYLVAQTQESARAATHATAATRDDVALRTALLYLDVERLARGAEVARRQVENLERVAAVVRLRAAEGREADIEARRAALAVAKARQRVLVLENARSAAASALARALGLKSEDELRAAAEERAALALPTEPDSEVAALGQSPEIKRLESILLAKGLEAKSYRAQRLPRVDFVAEYALFSKFNNYEQWFNAFQRNNGLVGASIQIPLFLGSTYDARAAQADLDARRIRNDINTTRAKVSAETRLAWQKIHEAESARDVARLDLEVARQQVGDVLAQLEEGRASLRQVEEARYLENEKWLSLYDARYAEERARLELLKQTSQLLAALR